MPQTTKRNEVEVIVVDDSWAEFGSSLPDRLPRRPTNTTSSSFKRWGIWSTAGFLTLIIHVLLLTPLLIGNSDHKSHPPLSDGDPASVQNTAADEFFSTLVMLNSRSITVREDQDESAFIALSHAATVSSAVDLVMTNATPELEVAGSVDGQDSVASTTEAAGDEAGRALLYGRYLGQIKARIERAWIHPATMLHTGFQCQVQIKQSQQGDVQEITLQRCGNDLTWQVSLVRAIQSASPLSAPPDEKIFSTVVTLKFDATSDVLANRAQ